MHRIVSTIKQDQILDLVVQGKRIGGRELDQYREISVEKGVIKTANGSARVKIGKTQVLVGVKLQHTEPFPDTPNSGTLMVNAELRPMASPTFEPGPPNENAIELARIIDRGIRESETIELDKLGIKEGEDVWGVFIDIHVLDHDGNLIDASALGAIAALLDVKPPQDEAWTLPEFSVKKRPVAVTLAKIDDKLLVDPCLDEENVMDARLTMTTTEEGNLCAIQKGGHGCFTREKLEQAYEIVRRKGDELRRYLG